MQKLCLGRSAIQQLEVGLRLPQQRRFQNLPYRACHLEHTPVVVVAVLRFSVPATEAVVNGYTSNLLQYVQRDKLVVPCAAALAGECVIAQYDALFSLNSRRNEVWVKLDEHLWWISYCLVALYMC